MEADIMIVWNTDYHVVKDDNSDKYINIHSHGYSRGNIFPEFCYIAEEIDQDEFVLVRSAMECLYEEYLCDGMPVDINYCHVFENVKLNGLVLRFGLVPIRCFGEPSLLVVRLFPCDNEHMTYNVVEECQKYKNRGRWQEIEFDDLWTDDYSGIFYIPGSSEFVEKFLRS